MKAIQWTLEGKTSTFKSIEGNVAERQPMIEWTPVAVEITLHSRGIFMSEILVCPLKLVMTPERCDRIGAFR